LCVCARARVCVSQILITEKKKKKKTGRNLRRKTQTETWRAHHVNKIQNFNLLSKKTRIKKIKYKQK
jgi:hypothetical protein